MYKQAESEIRSGLSRGARIMLGSFAGLFGAVLLAMAAISAMAPDDSTPSLGLAAIGLFCAVIALACATWGRVRQFLGSLIGSALFVIALWFLWTQASGAGPVLSGRRSEPSLLNAGLFLVFFGLPGVSYAVSTRFGFGGGDRCLRWTAE